MATRRKYKVPKYRDGGRVAVTDMPIADDDVVQAMQPAEPAPEPSVLPEPPPPPVEDDNPLLRAVEAQRHAEELQRHPPDPIDSFPISDFKKQMLRQHPELLSGWQCDFASRLYQHALQSGIQDDTAAMSDYILGGIQMQIVGHTQHAAENVRSTAPAMLPQQRAAPPPAPAPQPPLVPPVRRSMPMTAPVSRDIPSASGVRVPSSTSVHLTAEERHMAHISFTDPNMSNGQKELLYARNKQKLARLRAEGSYPERERN